jgi:hypothetical protein
MDGIVPQAVNDYIGAAVVPGVFSLTGGDADNLLALIAFAKFYHQRIALLFLALA